MSRVALLFLSMTACVPPPAPPPAPCPVIEPEPCDAITPEQRQVLEDLAVTLNAPLLEQSSGVRALVEERRRAVDEVERLRWELDACARANGELQGQVEQLKSDLEEVKRLTIEMEMKAK